MKRLYVVRHGFYDSRDRLSKEGKEQMIGLAEKIHITLDEVSVLILSSSAPRASDSAKEIGDVLQIGFEEFEELWSDDFHHGDWKKSYALIEERGVDIDIVIVVTHRDLAASLVRKFAEKFSIKGNCGSAGKGHALVVDIEEGSLKHIKP